MSSKSRSLVRCRVSAGFFRTEVLVIVGSSSAYMDRDHVQLQREPMTGEVDGLVSAFLIERCGDRALVELPGEPVVGGARTWISNDLLAPAGPVHP